jgi:cephalosporin-C deacetylase-like acetyl esterase
MMKFCSKIWLMAFLLFAGGNSYAQKQYKVLNWNSETDLNTYLFQQVHLQYLQRDADFKKALQSKASMLAYQDACKKNYISLLGKPTAPVNPDAHVIDRIKKDDYTIEKIIFTSFKGHHVTASVYIPKGKGPFPAAIIFCGHEAEAKATESYQNTAILFAKHGFEVLMADPISQGERYQLTDNTGKPLTKGGTTEHILLNVGSNLVGTSIAAYELWDNARSLDYLMSRAEVDKNRIGCLGNSGGGTQTGYMIAYDNRIKVSALCSYVLDSDHQMDLKGPPDGCVPIVGESKYKLEDADYFTMFAPKPVLVLAGRFDFVNYNRVVDVYHEVKKVYTVLGVPDKTALFTVDDGHGISKPKREAAITWFRRWLCNDARPVKEGNQETLSPQQLFSTTGGQVNNAFKDEITVNHHNLDLADELAAQRRLWAKVGAEKYLQQIKKIAGITVNPAKVETEWMGEIKKDDYTIQKIILRKPGEMPLPCLVLYSQKATPNGKVALWLPQQGKNKLADSINFIKSYMEKGYNLVIADLRGFGEETARTILNDSEVYNPDYRSANMTLSLAKPLTGQRTQDVLTLLDFISDDVQLKKLEVEVFATGFAGPAAIHAAVLDKRINKLELYNTISSYQSVLENPLKVNQFPYVIPNVMAYYDLPDLVNLIGTEKVKFE